MESVDSSSSASRPKRKIIPIRDCNGDIVVRPTKKVWVPRVMSEEEDEQMMVDDGIDEVVEIDVDGNEKVGSRRSVGPAASTSSRASTPEVVRMDKKKLGVFAMHLAVYRLKDKR
jgi:hypothetical protein